MNSKDKQKEIIINGKPFLLDSVFSHYPTQNIICTCYEHDEDGIGIRLALNWDHYWLYANVRELNEYYERNLDPEKSSRALILKRLNQEQYFAQFDDGIIKAHVFAYFTDPIEEALFVVI